MKRDKCDWGFIRLSAGSLFCCSPKTALQKGFAIIQPSIGRLLTDIPLMGAKQFQGSSLYNNDNCSSDKSYQVTELVF